MSKNNRLIVTLSCLILLSAVPTPCRAQEIPGRRPEEIDLKMQLLDTKLDLLDSKIRLWESKPGELDRKMLEADKRMHELESGVSSLDRKLKQADSTILAYWSRLEKEHKAEMAQQNYEQEFRPVFRSAVTLNPVRLFEGTFQISYERIFNDHFSLSGSLLGTYATQKGLTNYFFRNQEFSYYNLVNKAYEDYSGESIAGGGILLEARDYLLASFSGHQVAPLGLYAAPQVLYRRIWINGEDRKYVQDTLQTVEVKQQLNVFSAGVLIGYKVPFVKVLVADIFVGGYIRLSKYDGEAGLTKYKDWYNIDFSGVFPTAGVAFGILK